MQDGCYESPWGSVRYVLSGDLAGTAIVLLHGVLSDSTAFAPVVGLLSDRFRVMSVDLPGHGRSSRPERFSFEEAARCVLEIAEAEGLDEIVLCGCSLGGSVAQLCAWLDGGERVKGVFVADAMPLDAAAYDRLQAFAVDRSTSALRVSVQRSVRPAFRKLAKELAVTKEGRAIAARCLSEESLDGILWMNKAGNETLLRFVRHADHGFSTDIALGLAVGSKDRAVGVRARMAEWAVRRDVPLRRIEGAGHLSYLDDPNAFSGALCEFCNSIEAV